MRFGIVSLLAALLAIPVAPAVAAVDSPAMPEWMTGCWSEESGEGWTEECWMHPRGGVMLGASRSGRGDQVTETEMMRIDLSVPNGEGSIIKMAFSAAQQAGGWTRFAWSPSEGQGVSFYNAAHDYPQRIRYWRDGRMLIAEIAMLDGSKSRTWRYEPMTR